MCVCTCVFTGNIILLIRSGKERQGRKTRARDTDPVSPSEFHSSDGENEQSKD